MILVTGATGYLGQHVVARLRTREGLAWCAPADAHRLRDLTRSEDMRALIAETQPDVVIHCAAVVPKTPSAYHDEQAAFDSLAMAVHLAQAGAPRIVFASSLAVTAPISAYARSKSAIESVVLRGNDVALRLPGLFGLPRRSGVIYEAAQEGVVRESYGPWPAMHVADAAEYLVRAATMPNDGGGPFRVVYGDERLEASYGSVEMTFGQRVRELIYIVQAEQACTRL